MSGDPPYSLTDFLDEAGVDESVGPNRPSGSTASLLPRM
jgi:hypothetical protein